MGVAKNGNPSAEDILDHIVSVGVCKVADYNAHGTACQKYRISGYNIVGASSNSDLAAAVRVAPVYVEVGVDPYAYQLYSKYSTQPLSASYNRPTIAGVLTGYTVDGDNSYWELYTRRHGANNNEVHIKLDRFALPFAAWELRLYLDTHPDDERALAAYKKLCATIGGCSYPCVTPQGMMAAGTDSSSSCQCGGRWNWIDDPWPWDLKGE